MVSNEQKAIQILHKTLYKDVFSVITAFIGPILNSPKKSILVDHHTEFINYIDQFYKIIHYCKCVCQWDFKNTTDETKNYINFLRKKYDDDNKSNSQSIVNRTRNSFRSIGKILSPIKENNNNTRSRNTMRNTIRNTPQDQDQDQDSEKYSDKHFDFLGKVFSFLIIIVNILNLLEELGENNITKKSIDLIGEKWNLPISREQHLDCVLETLKNTIVPSSTSSSSSSSSRSTLLNSSSANNTKMNTKTIFAIEPDVWQNMFAEDLVRQQFVNIVSFCDIMMAFHTDIHRSNSSHENVVKMIGHTFDFLNGITEKKRAAREARATKTPKTPSNVSMR